MKHELLNYNKILADIFASILSNVPELIKTTNVLRLSAKISTNLPTVLDL